jgi:hypothetical protein
MVSLFMVTDGHYTVSLEQLSKEAKEGNVKHSVSVFRRIRLQTVRTGALCVEPLKSSFRNSNCHSGEVDYPLPSLLLLT